MVEREGVRGGRGRGGGRQAGRQGKLISTALAHKVVHTEKKRRRYLEYPVRKASNSEIDTREFYELPLISRIYLAERKSARLLAENTGKELYTQTRCEII